MRRSAARAATSRDVAKVNVRTDGCEDVASASAPGKLILFGEHAVVFGEPALATAVDLRTEVFVRGHTEWLADGASIEEPRYRYVRAALDRAWDGGPLWVEVRSMIPPASGLGSSAAVTVATIGAASTLSGVARRPEEVARLGFEVEHEVQGRASPIDTTTVTAGGAVLVRPGHGDGLLWTIRRGDRSWSLHACNLPTLELVVGSTGVAAATGPLVAGVRNRVARDPSAAEDVRTIGRLVVEGLTALQAEDYPRAGALMNRNHEILNRLGVGHPKLDRLVEAARPYSHGAKLTGAGGGGSMVALTDRSDRVAEAIEDAGGRAFLVRTSSLGLEVGR